MRRNDDPRSGVGIDNGVLDQVADSDAELASVTQHSRPRNSGNRESDPTPFRVHSSPLDSVSQHLIDRRRSQDQRADRRIEVSTAR